MVATLFRFRLIGKNLNNAFGGIFVRSFKHSAVKKPVDSNTLRKKALAFSCSKVYIAATTEQKEAGRKGFCVTVVKALFELLPLKTTKVH